MGPRNWFWSLLALAGWQWQPVNNGLTVEEEEDAVAEEEFEDETEVDVDGTEELEVPEKGEVPKEDIFSDSDSDSEDQNVTALM